MTREAYGTSHRPTWAVVVPAFNEAARIGDALASLAAQSEPAEEIVVVDDGSEDDLEGAVADDLGMVELVRQPNRGLAAARNTGTAQVSSDWVLYLDADDHLDPQALEALRDAAVRDPGLDLLELDALGYDESTGEVLYRHRERQPFDREDQRAAIVQRNLLLTGVSVRRERMNEIGGFDEGMRFCEDYECWMRLILAGSRAGSVDGCFLHRRHHGANMSSKRPEMISWRMEVIRRALARDDLDERERRLAMQSLQRNAHLLHMLQARARIHMWADELQSELTDRRGTMTLLRQRGPSARQRVLLSMGMVSPRLTGRVANRFRVAP